MSINTITTPTELFTQLSGYTCFQYAKQIRESGQTPRATVMISNIYDKVTYEKKKTEPDEIMFSNKYDNIALCGHITSAEFVPVGKGSDRLKVSFDNCDSTFEIMCYRK